MHTSPVHISRVHIARSLCAPSVVDAPSHDIWLDGDRIARITPNDQPPVATVLSCPVDVHVHIDKTGVVERTGPAQGDLHKAIGMMAAARDAFTEQDIRQRMTVAIEQAYRCGTRAMRTHLDWPDRAPPKSLAVLESLRDEWHGRMTLQAASLTPLDYFLDDSASVFDSEDLGLEVATADQVCNKSAGERVALGAFVWRNPRMFDKLQRVFDLAIKSGLLLDFHVDEGLDPDARGLQAIAELTIKNGMQGRVTCGHACSLSVQPLATAQATLALCAKAGIHLVALPTTNAYLQGSWAETPVERGIFRINEALVAGNTCSVATDNVADAFFPYGSYDLIDNFAFGVQLAHLCPADEWLSSITVAPARAMALPWDGLLAQGAPADLVVLAAKDAYQLMTPAGRIRRVIRSGVELSNRLMAS